MDILTFLPIFVLIGAMFLMTRSAKKKQQQAADMRNSMTPGSGIRTIGGMYATVKEVHDESVLLEVAPGVHAIYAKNAIGAVLDDEEYNRIIHGVEGDESDAPVVPDDASSLTKDDEDGDTARIDLGKKADDADQDAADATPKKTDGESDTK
ncbi:preprotein translocase subunit YajC [Streptomyces sp. DR3-1]|uniref:preprotein translocase subunit YajC n=1 Tax=Streptomyces sp. DR3-1 TaxID=2951169 RepID=UPI0020430E9E|nr:preprotein translocase subunit YajC [Streptomyces sp. DR3-1]MCM3818824.1 preprotein translocase subunit YajC [Streptomyces sp. DR3-1]